MGRRADAVGSDPVGSPQEDSRSGLRSRSATSGPQNDVGDVSGSWVTGRPPSGEPGLMVYIMVDSVEASMQAVVRAGGTIVQPIGADPGEVTARFSDPAGNVLSVLQDR